MKFHARLSALARRADRTRPQWKRIVTVTQDVDGPGHHDIYGAPVTDEELAVLRADPGVFLIYVMHDGVRDD